MRDPRRYKRALRFFVWAAPLVLLALVFTFMLSPTLNSEPLAPTSTRSIQFPSTGRYLISLPATINSPTIADSADLFNALDAAVGCGFVGRHDPVDDKLVVYDSSGCYRCGFDLSGCVPDPGLGCGCFCVNTTDGHGYLVDVGPGIFSMDASDGVTNILLQSAGSAGSNSGTNFISIPYDTPMTMASHLFQEIGVAQAIQRYLTGSDIFQTYTFGTPDFPLQCGEGYVAKVEVDMNYVPSWGYGLPPECGQGGIECGDGNVEAPETCDPPGSGACDCCYDHPTLGCEDTVCEAEVCAIDPSCCSVEWDVTCANLAQATPECLECCLEMCRDDCTYCGDGNPDIPPEQCDDGNFQNDDGCDTDCELEPIACGDGDVAPPETCDPPGSIPGDGGSLTLYGTAHQGGPGSPSELYIIDPFSGTPTNVGPIGFDHVGDIDFHPITGILYGVGQRPTDGTDVLIAINPTTGAGVEIGPFVNPVVAEHFDLSFRSDGVLYMLTVGPTSCRALFRIDTITGEATEVGSGGGTGTCSSGNALGYDSADTLYLLDLDFAPGGPEGTVWTVNDATGGASPVAPITYLGFPPFNTNPRSNALDFRPGTEFGYVGVNDSDSPSSGPNYLATLDPVTGEVNHIGQTVTGLAGLAWPFGEQICREDCTYCGDGIVNGPGSFAAATELIVNGDFETGSFAPWITINSADDGDFFISTPGVAMPISGFLTSPNPNGGSFYAVSDEGAAETLALAQTFAVPADATRVVLSFEMFVDDWNDQGAIIDPIGLDHTGPPNQHARVDIMASGSPPFGTGTGVVATYYLGADPGPLPNPYLAYAFDITFDVAPGETYELRFANTVNQYPLHQGVDNVSIVASNAPIGPEECDDGNNLPGDGCDPDCQNEEPLCGNLVVEPPETCDPPGSTVPESWILYGSAHPDGAYDPSILYTIDHTSGAATPVGPIGFNHVTDIDLDPTTGILYGVGVRPGEYDPVLITIDPVGGTGTEIGPLNIGDLPHDISFRSDGTLFVVAGYDGGGCSLRLYEIDKESGDADSLPESMSCDPGNALGYDLGDTLYLSTSRAFSGPEGTLWEVDDAVGDATPAAALLHVGFPQLNGPRSNALDFNPVTGIGYVNVNDGSNGPNYVATLDPASGEVSHIGLTVPRMAGLAWVPIEMICRNDCSYCGDGNVDMPEEECDDGSNLPGDGCDFFCNWEDECGGQPWSTPCEDTDGNDCTVAGCDGQGNCDQDHLFVEPSTPCDPDEPYDYECTTPGCDGMGYCDPQHIPGPPSEPCSDIDNNDCTIAGCDGMGFCDQHHITPESTPCPDSDGNDCTVAGCDGAGNCDQFHILEEPSTPCDPEIPFDPECSTPGCDAQGFCNPTYFTEPPGFPCEDIDDNACTIARCDGIGTCDQFFFTPESNPCGGGALDTECAAAGCNGQGECDPLHIPVNASVPCEDIDGNECTVAGCDGLGLCDQLHVFPESNPCGGGELDTECASAGCDGQGNCDPLHLPTDASTPCTDDDGNFCTGAGCDGLGNCDQRHLFTNPNEPCPDVDENECTVAGCDGLGNCDQLHILIDPSTPCDPDEPFDPQCTTPGCDGQGFCDPRHLPAPPSEPCQDIDGNECTIAGCDGIGSCDQHHITPESSPCDPEEPFDPQCTTPGCDGQGFCDPFHIPTEPSTPCDPGVPFESECTTPGCNGFGVCDPLHIAEPPSTPCTDGDGNVCTIAGCDGFGLCNQGHILPNSNPCPDTDGDFCTIAGCNGGGGCDQEHIRECTCGDNIVEPPETCDPPFSSPGGAPVLYGTAHPAGSGTASTLYRIDGNTGLSAPIGPIGFDHVGDIDFDPTTGILYGVGLRPSDGVHVLIEINPTTGAGFQVGPLVNTDPTRKLFDVSFRSDGNLYMTAFSNLGGCIALYQINTGSGLATEIGTGTGTGTCSPGNALGFNLGDVAHQIDQAPFYTGVDGTLYLVDEVLGVSNAVNRIVYLGLPSFLNDRSNGMDFHPVTDVGYVSISLGNAGPGRSYLGILDPTTGNVMLVGRTVNGLAGIAWGPGDLCRGECTYCGDNIVNGPPGAEECDDGNNADGDGCSSTCCFDFDGDLLCDVSDPCPDAPDSFDGPVFGQTVRAFSKTLFGWTRPLAYEWVKGNFVLSSHIRTYPFAGPFLAGGTTTFDGAMPAPGGNGFWYLWKPECPGGLWTSEGGGECALTGIPGCVTGGRDNSGFLP